MRGTLWPLRRGSRALDATSLLESGTSPARGPRRHRPGRHAAVSLADTVTLPAAPGGQPPYPELPAGRVAAYRAAAAQEPPAPRFIPAPTAARETRPVPVAPALPRRAPVPAVAAARASDERLLQRVLDGLRTYDGTPQALSPVHDKTLLRFRSAVRPVRRHGDAVARRAQALDYPPPGLAAVAGHGAYHDVMRHADRVTGTSGSGQFRPALPAGGAS